MATTTLTPAQELRLAASNALNFGEIHADGRDGLEGFGYLGLGFCPHHTEREQIIARALKDVLDLTAPKDIRTIRTPDGRRILVRVFDEHRKPTSAFKVAREFAHLAGV